METALSLYQDQSHCPFLRLPDELIDDIINHAVNPSIQLVSAGGRAYDSQKDSEYRHSVLKISRTCRRLRAISLPYMYHSLSFEFRNVYGETSLSTTFAVDQKTILLYRTLKENPGLGRFCNNLTLHTISLDPLDQQAYWTREQEAVPPPHTVTRVSDLFGLFPSVTKIRYTLHKNHFLEYLWRDGQFKTLKHLEIHSSRIARANPRYNLDPEKVISKVSLSLNLTSTMSMTD
jgi:hypothetical protein